MKGYSILVLMLLANPVLSQKLKFKLELKDSLYEGTMNPKWYDQVTVTPVNNDLQNLAGAKGKMEGDHFGTMNFTIENNKTGTSDHLMVRTSNGWYPIFDLKFKGPSLRLSFDWSFRPEPALIDLQVLKHADELLASDHQWNNKDDRKCADDFANQKWSLYCVLKKAYLDVTNDFNHRAAGLNMVRSTIEIMYPEKEYQHRLMDFNNEEEFTIIKNLLSMSIKQIENSISQKDD